MRYATPTVQRSTPGGFVRSAGAQPSLRVRFRQSRDATWRRHKKGQAMIISLARIVKGVAFGALPVIWIAIGIAA